MHPWTHGPTNYGSRLDRGARRTRAQPEEHRRRPAPRTASWSSPGRRVGQVVARLRHHLRRGAAALRRVALGLRPPVPRADWRSPTSTASRGSRPAIAIEQKALASNPRSTVGTVTEIADYLRLLFARIGVPHCPNCGREIASQSLERIIDLVMTCPQDERINVLAPLVRGRKGEFKKELESLRTRGFTKARIDGQFRSLEDDIRLDRRKNDTIEVVVDRLIVRSGIERRLTESIETALQLANEIVVINGLDEGDRLFSRRMACVNCGISVPELSPRAFSFNSPHGACPACQGLGAIWDLDPGARRARPLEIAGRRGHRAVGARRQEADRRRARVARRRPSASRSTCRLAACRRNIGTCCCMGLRARRPLWSRRATEGSGLEEEEGAARAVRQGLRRYPAEPAPTLQRGHVDAAGRHGALPGAQRLSRVPR